MTHALETPAQRTAPRLDEVPDLVDRADDLVGLRVHDVMIREVVDDEGSLGWMAVVMLYQPVKTPHWSRPIPWMLGLRPTEDEARAAVTALLRGLLKGRKRAMRDHPSTEGEPTPRTRAVMNAACDAMHREWVERQYPPAPTGGHPGARPHRTDLPSGVPAHVVEWAAGVRATRTGWGWTQKELAAKIDLDAARLSKLERGKWLPPDDVIKRLCDVLDLHAPKEASDG